MRAENLWASFLYAFEGFWYALSTQRNLRVHVMIAALVLVLSWVEELPIRDFIAVLLAIVVVMVAELFNTSLEAVVDLISPDIRRLAKTAKDVAAAAVLLAASGAVVLGLWVFLPRLGRLPGFLMLRWERQPAAVIAWLGLLVAVAALMVWIPQAPHRRGGR